MRITAGRALGLTLDGAQNRLTFSGRASESFHRSIARQLENEQQLADAWEALGAFDVRRVLFERESFEAQVAAVRRTDVLVGMHGAGMAHALWLPRGARVIEVFSGDTLVRRPAQSRPQCCPCSLLSCTFVSSFASSVERASRSRPPDRLWCADCARRRERGEESIAVKHQLAPIPTGRPG